MAEYTVNAYRLNHAGVVHSRGQTVTVEDKALAKRLLASGVVVQQGEKHKRGSQGTHPDQQKSSDSDSKSKSSSKSE